MKVGADIGGSAEGSDTSAAVSTTHAPVRGGAVQRQTDTDSVMEGWLAPGQLHSSESQIGSVPTPVSDTLLSTCCRLSPSSSFLLASPCSGSSALLGDARKGIYVVLLRGSEFNVIPRRPGARLRVGLLERRVGRGRLWCRRVTGRPTCPAPWLPKAMHGEQFESSPRSLSSLSPTSLPSPVGVRARAAGTLPIVPAESPCALVVFVMRLLVEPRSWSRPIMMVPMTLTRPAVPTSSTSATTRS